MILQYQKSQTDLLFFFRFWDIQLYMTEPPNSSELETVAVESTAILFNVRSKNYRLHKVKANVGHKIFKLGAESRFFISPCVYQWLLNVYFGRQWRLKYIVALCGIWSGSSLFIYTNMMFREKNVVRYNSFGEEKCDVYSKTSSPMGDDRSPESQHNVWRYHNWWCWKAGNSELETVTRN